MWSSGSFQENVKKLTIFIDYQYYMLVMMRWFNLVIQGKLIILTNNKLADS